MLQRVYPVTKAVQIAKIPTVVVSIVVGSAQTCCALIQSMCDVKAAQMDVQFNLIQELILYEFDLSQNAAETTKYL